MAATAKLTRLDDAVGVADDAVKAAQAAWTDALFIRYPVDRQCLIAVRDAELAEAKRKLDVAVDALIAEMDGSAEADRHPIDEDGELLDQGDEPTAGELLDADEDDARRADAMLDAGRCPGLGTVCDWTDKRRCLKLDYCCLKL